MSRILAVHGIGQQFKGEETLRRVWEPALRDGLQRANFKLPEGELACAFYGDLFRPKGKKSITLPPLDASDVVVGLETTLLEAWWREAAAVEKAVPGPEAKTKGRTPRVVQRALNALSFSKFFAGVAERVLIFDLKQVAMYFSDSAMRLKIRSRVAEELTPDTKVVIGHSLGSVVAYEVLCTLPKTEIEALVTLGSPLGIRNIIFDKLEPPPAEGKGIWPTGVKRWFNIADGGDVVALVKELRPQFGEEVIDSRIYNGATAHSIEPYLTARETGEAIAVGLRD